MNKRLNILFVSNLFPNPQELGRGVFSLQLVKRIQEIGDVRVVCPLPWFPKLPALRRFPKWYRYSLVPDQYEIDGITVFAPKYPLIPKASRSIHPALMRQSLGSCIGQLHASRPIDVINSQWLYPDSVTVDPISRKLGIPHAVTALGCDANQSLATGPEAPRIVNMLRNADQITTVADTISAIIRQHPGTENKVTTILNGVDANKFPVQDQSECRKMLHLPEEIKTCIFVGRLSEEKSVSTLIEAIAELNRDGSPIKLFLVGEGPLRESLQNQARSLNLTQEHIQFVGNVPHADVPAWIGSGDMLCLPSLREGCPNVVLESIAAGVPVVASRVGAIPDILTEKTGVLAEPANPRSFAKALRIAYNKNWDRQQIANRAKAFTWETAAQAYVDTYHKAMQKL